MAAPTKLSVVYATDELIAVRARGDFPTLCPDWQRLALGSDGVVDSGSPWVLTSATVDFEEAGVANGHVIQITKPGTVRGSGDLLAVDSVSGGSVTLRRLKGDSGKGQPPVVATALTFSIATLDPQTEEASFALNRRFGIDPGIAGRSPTTLYDIRDLREATILTVLRAGYTQEARGKGDFADKCKLISEELGEVIARLEVRWAVDGEISESTTISSRSRVTR